MRWRGGHLAGELFMMMTGIKLIHVTYRGESLAMADLITGQAQIRVRDHRLGARLC
jgi:tripartite-type tricarboxylate transporter receptor subunit TctC